jgi:DNA-binding SARP family transcriptional activator/tetratricopeptide (TPR) repeat protein
MAQPTIVRASTPAPVAPTPDLMPERPPRQRKDGRRSEPEPEPLSVIPSKVQSPVVRASTLARGRLLEWLDRHALDRVCVIAAEAGFGKTTLLADWARRTQLQVRWLKLDASDAEWTTFLSYLIAAFREGAPQFGIATQRLLAHMATLGTTMDQATGTFLGELGRTVTEPTVLIIDDLQLVQDNHDVRTILERLLERAPERLTFVIAGRSKPELRLGRLSAQGKVAILGTDDLRFSWKETSELFAVSYRLPLEPDLVGLLEARTEGWGASLQLVYSSIRSQPPGRARQFIQALEGSREPLYDFLAEEVLGRQTPLMQRVLLHAALLDRIVPALVVAALSAGPDVPAPDSVVDALESADELGLMSRNAERSASRRFHPLLREFLSSHLVRTTPPDQLRQMHLRVAAAAEAIHWPTSAHHYIEGGAGKDAMRVIGEASVQALGTGAWGEAMRLTARMPNVEPTTPVEVLRARSLVAQGKASDALRMLETMLSRGTVAPADRYLVNLAMASSLGHGGRPDEVAEWLALVVADPHSPPVVAGLAAVWLGMHTGRDEAHNVRSLIALAEEAKSQGLHLYAALAYHNAASNLLALARYPESLDCANSALEQFADVSDAPGDMASTYTVIAHALFEMGRLDDVPQVLSTAMRHQDAQADAFAESATLKLWLGDLDGAESDLARGRHALVDREHLPTESHAVEAAGLLLQLAAGTESPQASTFLPSSGTWDPNLHGYLLTTSAIASSLLPRDTSIEADLSPGTRRDSAPPRWVPYLRLIAALRRGDRGEIAALMSRETGMTDGPVLALADVIATHMHLVPEQDARLRSLAMAWPDRWRNALRRTLSTGRLEASRRAAVLLSEIGTQSDVGLIAAWEKSQKRGSRDTALSVSLARRVSPTLRIMDLGRAVVALGQREVPVVSVRRKAAALLLFIASRPNYTATRDQVCEVLWPGQDTDVSANSLHQTLFFLRREFVADPRLGRPPVEYIPVGSEVISLDAGLVHVESLAFSRVATDLGKRGAGTSQALGVIFSYGGKFAPEFEYEDWAMSWRDHVHACFLNLVEQAARARMAPEGAADAVTILRHALQVDPEAIDLKPLLAAAHLIAGSQAAARSLYGQWVAESEREYDISPPPLQDLVAQVVAEARDRRQRR